MTVAWLAGCWGRGLLVPALPASCASTTTRISLPPISLLFLILPSPITCLFHIPPFLPLACLHCIAHTLSNTSHPSSPCPFHPPYKHPPLYLGWSYSVNISVQTVFTYYTVLLTVLQSPLVPSLLHPPQYKTILQSSYLTRSNHVERNEEA